MMMKAQAISLLQIGLLALALKGAYGQEIPYQVSVGLEEGVVTADKLHHMNAEKGQILRFDGRNWAPDDLPSALTYGGNWNASSNSPDLTNGGGRQGGLYYLVIVAGSTDLDGGTGTASWQVGDWAVWNEVESRWEKVTHGSTRLTGFNGRRGAVTPQTGDYTWDQIDKSGSSLDDIADVSVSGISSGQVLKWDGSRWVAGNDNAGGTVSPSQVTGLSATLGELRTLADSKETAISAGTTGEYLRGDKSWQTLDTSAVAEGSRKYYTAVRARGDLIQTTINNSTSKAVTSKAVKDALSAKQNALNLNYSLPGSDGSSGQVLATDGSGSLGWTTPASSISNLGDVGNVDTSSKSNGKVLKWDGSKWVAGDDLQGGGAGSVSSSTILDGTIVDADIAANAGVAQSKISDLTGDLDQLETDVGALLTRITGLDSSVSTLNSQVSGLDTGSVAEGSRKYYTATRARSDLLQATINNSTTKAVTSKAVKDALAGKQDNLNLGYSLPTGDGSGDQVLVTDGAGSLSWTTPASAISVLNDIANVDTSSKGNGKVLKWDGSKWVAGDDLRSGGPGSVNSGAIQDGSIVDVDIASSAQIAQSKIEDLTGDLDQLETEVVSDLLGRVTGLDTSISTLNSQVGGLDTGSVAEGSK